MALRLRAQPQTGADLTIFGGEFDFDDLVGSVADSRSPTTAGVPLWTGGLLLFPVDEEVVGIEAFQLLGLPLMVAAGWTYQINLIVALTLHQELCVYIACIDEMLSGQ